jgi:hypothetical protein
MDFTEAVVLPGFPHGCRRIGSRIGYRLGYRTEPIPSTRDGDSLGCDSASGARKGLRGLRLARGQCYHRWEQHQS